MQGSAQSTPSRENRAQKNDEPPTQLRRKLEALVNEVGRWEKGPSILRRPLEKRADQMECLFNRICWSLEHPDASAEALHAEQLLRQGMWNTLLGDLDDPIGAFTNGGRSTVLHTLAAAFCSFWASVSRQSRADLHKSDQRWTQRADELRQQAQDLSTSVDDLRAEVALLRDTVQ